MAVLGNVPESSRIFLIVNYILAAVYFSSLITLRSGEDGVRSFTFSIPWMARLAFVN